MNIKETIKPFILIEGERNTQLILNAGNYRDEIFQERVEEGFLGNGYDWASLASVFLDEKMPELGSTIQLDPEADMFCVYSSDKAAIEQFAVAFHSMCEDETLMRDLFSRAKLD